MTPFGRLLTARVCFSGCYALLLIGLPLILAGRNVEVSRIGFVMGSYAAGVLAGRPLATWLLGIRSRKRVSTYGAALIGGSILLYWWVPDVSSYMVFRVLQGVGSSLLITATTTMAIDRTPKHRRGRSLSYLGMSHTAVLSAGPLLAVLLLEQAGPNLLFAGTAGVALIGLVLLSRVVEEVHPENLQPPGERERNRGIGRPVLLATVLLFLNAVVHGGVFYFLPLQVGQTLNGNGGVFFTCFAVAALSGRLVSGRAADRLGRLPAGFLAQVLLIAGVYLIGGVDSMTGLGCRGTRLRSRLRRLHDRHDHVRLGPYQPRESPPDHRPLLQRPRSGKFGGGMAVGTGGGEHRNTGHAPCLLRDQPGGRSPVPAGIGTEPGAPAVNEVQRVSSVIHLRSNSRSRRWTRALSSLSRA